MTEFDPALELTREYVREEFEQVVLAQGITSRDGYREASRRGRGKVLSRKKRDSLWDIFETYRLNLSAKGLKEPDDAYRDATEIVKSEGFSIRYFYQGETSSAVFFPIFLPVEVVRRGVVRPKASFLLIFEVFHIFEILFSVSLENFELL